MDEGQKGLGLYRDASFCVNARPIVLNGMSWRKEGDNDRCLSWCLAVLLSAQP